MKEGIIIKKVITALGFNSVNLKMKEKKEVEVIGNDIPYQDGVLDILKENSEIDTLALNENLVGEYEIRDFIDKIIEINKNIEIIFFMENENYKLREYLEKKEISKIVIMSELKDDDIIKMILEVNDLKKQIDNLSEIIKFKKNTKKLRISKVIAIAGNYGSGKSLITSLMGKAAKKNNLKTIIIDFDIINSSINTIFRIKKYKNYDNKDDIESFITHISNNLDVICGIDLIFNEENKISYEKVENLFFYLKDVYDLILIDSSSETYLKYMKVVFANIDNIIFLIEPNLLEIKKAERLLEIYIEDWEIYPQKIMILQNKVNVNSVDEKIVKEIFNRFKIIGKIDFSNKFTQFANDIRGEKFGLNKYINILEKIS